MKLKEILAVCSPFINILVGTENSCGWLFYGVHHQFEASHDYALLANRLVAGILVHSGRAENANACAIAPGTLAIVIEGTETRKI